MSADGTWNITLNTPMGARRNMLTLASNGNQLTGTMSGDQGTREIEHGKVDGDAISWSIVAPQMGMTIEFSAQVDGDKLSGHATLGAFGDAPVEGTRA